MLLFYLFLRNTQEKRGIRMKKEVRGIFHILMAAIFFSLMNVFVKMSGDLPTFQKAFFRNAVAAVVAIYILSKTPERFAIRKGSYKTLILRSIFGTLGIFANFWAIDHLGLADANMLNKMSPFFATLMSIWIVKEKPSFFEIACICIAFIGAGFVVKPTSGVASLPAIIGLFGGFCAGTAYTFVRKLGTHGERGPVIVMFFSVFSTIVCIPFIVANHQAMTMTQVLILIGAGICAAIAQLNVTKAYTFAPASKISIYDYTQVLFGALWGLIFFDEIPDAYSFIGYAIIIGVAIVKYIGARQKTIEA